MVNVFSLLPLAMMKLPVKGLLPHAINNHELDKIYVAVLFRLWIINSAKLCSLKA